ncbi:hypothetical protein ACFE04_024615 [Oxalis oulophora]
MKGNMKYHHRKYLLVLFLFTFNTTTYATIGLFQRAHVRITNEMNTKVINQHCYGDGDDRGYHYLSPNMFTEFSFITLVSNKFYCSVWDEKDNRIIYFIAYDSSDHRYKDAFCGDIHIDDDEDSGRMQVMTSRTVDRRRRGEGRMV